MSVSKKTMYAALAAVLIISASAAIFVYGGSALKNVFYNTSEISIEVTPYSEHEDSKIWIYINDDVALEGAVLEPDGSLEIMYEYQSFKLKKDHSLEIRLVSYGGDDGAKLDFKKVTVGSGQSHSVHLVG